MLKIPLENKLWQWVTLIFLSFIWGSSFILMKKSLLAFDNLQVAAFRVFFSFFLLLPFALKNLKKITGKNIKSLLIVGFIGTAIPAYFYSTAQTYIDSSLAGILNSLTPLFTLIIGLLLYNTKTKLVNIIGIFIAFFGAAGLIVKDFTHILQSINWHATLVVCATICYGINVNEIKEKLSMLSGLEITSLGLFFTGPVALVYLLQSDFSSAIIHQDFYLSLIAVFSLAALCTVLALIIFNTLIKYTTAIFAASVTYIIPVFAILWGFIDGEKLLLVQFLWMILIMIGVYLVNRRI